MADQSLSQSPAFGNQSVVFVPAEFLEGEAIPSLIEVAGQFVHAPVVDGSTVLVDTGRAIIDLTMSEVNVLRSVISAMDAAGIVL